MSDETALREKARSAIQKGRLPLHTPDRVWGGPGINALCAICAVPVTADEMEVELQFAHDGDSPGMHRCPVHLACFAAWEFERSRT